MLLSRSLLAARQRSLLSAASDGACGGVRVAQQQRGAAMSDGAAPALAAAAAPPPAIVAYVTVPDKETGERIARALLDARLVACANIIPGITSLYRWKGEVQSDAELMMVLKTRASLLEALTTAVRAAHPYDEPEVIATAVVGGSSGYLSWVADSTLPPSS